MTSGENAYLKTSKAQCASFDDALDALSREKNNLIKWKDELLSETDTRCKMIDQIMKEVLHWDEHSIRREVHIDESPEHQYIDYIYKSDNNLFLIEAKKNGVYFNTSVTVKKCKSTGALSKDPTTKKALEQMKKYCKDYNIPVGCICNGYQFIVFLNENMPDNRYDTYVFNDINNIENDIVNFYNIFSPYSNSCNILKELFIYKSDRIRDIPQISKSILDIIYNPNEKISRNPVDSYVRPIIGEFFSELVSEGNIKYLKECYCSDERSTQYEKQLTALLADELPKLETPIQDSYYFGDDFVRKGKEFLKSFGKRSDVMMLVGGVGAGKTTFIHKYFNFDIPEEINKNIIWIYVDFLKVSSEKIDIKEYIITECLKQLREKYSFLKIDEWRTLQEIYRADIIRWQKGSLKPYYENNRKEYEKIIADRLFEKQNNDLVFGEDALRYLSMKQDYKKMICLTIDNADQKSEEFQINSLKAAYDFSMSIKSLVILSMREASYWKLRNSNPFDAYPGYAYHITAPSVSDIISKRINIACRYLKNQKMYLTAPNSLRVEIKINDFFEIVSNSLNENNSALKSGIALLEVLSVNNLRVATGMLGSFLTSGHTNTLEYILTYLNKGNYQIPYHAFVRSISLGDYRIYHSKESLIMNIIQIEEDGFYSHFTKLRIIRYLYNRSHISNAIGKGYVNIKNMYNDFAEVCNNEYNFRTTLSTLLKHRLILTDKEFDDNQCEGEYVKLSPSGYYYLEVLMKEFSYLERLCEDTSIIANDYFLKIEKLTNLIINDTSNNKDKVLKLRLSRIKEFLNYLSAQECDEQQYISNPEMNFIFMLDIIQGFDNSIQETKLKNYL